MIGDLPVRCEVALVDVDEGMLNSCVEAILGVTSPPLVVLFNSRAKGTAVEGSDLDLLVVEEPADPTTWSRVREMVRLRRCLPPWASRSMSSSTRPPRSSAGDTRSTTPWPTPCDRGGCFTSETDHARELLKLACRDLSALRGMTGDRASCFADEIFGFRAQQAAEKCLKARIAVLGRAYERTHDIRELVRNLESSGEDVNGLIFLVDVNPYAVLLRHPIDAEAGPAALDRSPWIDSLVGLVERCRRSIELSATRSPESGPTLGDHPPLAVEDAAVDRPGS